MLFFANRLPRADKLSIKGLKVGIPVEYYHEHLSKEMLEVWNDTAKILEDGGATVKQVGNVVEVKNVLIFMQIQNCTKYDKKYTYLRIKYNSYKYRVQSTFTVGVQIEFA